MNKHDLKLLIFLVLIGIVFILFIKINNNSDNKLAVVYYENKEVLKIDLKIDKEYIVKGYNGEVVIKVKNKKIKVDQENSPLNLCSKQGYISSSYETIVCLPNKIVVKIIDKEVIDAKV